MKDNIEPFLCCICINTYYKCSRNIREIAKNLRCPDIRCLSLKMRHTLNLSIRLWLMSMDSILFFFKNDSSVPDFCHSDVLVIWQQSAPKSDKSRWLNSGCELHEQSGLWETQDSHLILPRAFFPQFLHFFIRRGTFPPDFIQWPRSMGCQYVLIAVCVF